MPPVRPERYETQARLPQVGNAGQRSLAEKRVLIVGVGGLGCASAAYLAMSGVGRLRLVDGDSVALSNLGRQVLFGDADLGRPKVVAAKYRLRAMNPEIAVEPVHAFADRGNLAELLRDVDLVVDGTDSLGARRLLNRALVTLGIPVVFGAATGMNGTVMAGLPGGPCYDCVWQEPSDTTCETAGVLGPLVGLVGAAQAAEALRVLLRFAEPGRLHLTDQLRGEWRTVRVSRRSDCPTCGPR